ncbi:SapC family protein [Ancylobacter sp. IITR112]|uniref:SapC family protein n=1 Tax=Ancylobacter sp. IITR112 TaxID=3138073 RepID=UPI00352B1E2A
MSTGTSNPAPGLPPFYGSPALVRFPDHRLIGLRDGVDFGFARAAAAIPLVAPEFVHALSSYPIVFSTEEGAAPLAVTGLTAGENLFVRADGGWTEGDYVPSYVRRYPFIGMTPAEGEAMLLGLDLSAAQVSTDVVRDGARALFDEDGTASETAKAAIAFCEAYAVEHERTRAFGAALEAENLLVSREARVTLPDGTEKLIQGFRLIDEAAFRALSGATLESFHTNGWTDLVILHLASQQSWRRLANRAFPAA